MLAACCIPVMMVVLGATLSNGEGTCTTHTHRGPSPRPCTHTHSFLAAAGPGVADVPFKTILSISVFRLLVLPLLMAALVLGAYHIGAFHAPDPIFLLVLLIQNTVPTAINIHTSESCYGHQHKYQ